MIWIQRLGLRKTGPFLFLLWLSPVLYSQSSAIDLGDFDKKKVIENLVGAVNEARSKIGLPLLHYSEVLQKAGNDQAVFNRKINRIESEQPKSKKATPFLRVKYYEGLYASVDEYDLGIEIDTKNRLRSSRRSKNPSTYAELIDYVIHEWQDDRKHADLLTSNVFHAVGIGLAPNKYDNLLFITVVLASEPYEKVSGFKYSSRAYKIHPYERDVCKYYDRNFSFIPELFSNNLKIIGRKIQFYYHDLRLMENLLESSRDALAVDIVLKDQFDCSHGNVLHPSGVYDGMMLKPIKKKKLLRRNKLKEANEFLADLGNIPVNIDTGDVTLSLLVIKDKCRCSKVLYNDLNGQNIRLLKIDLAVDTLSITQSVDSNSRYLTFTVPFEKNKFRYEVEDIKPFLDSIQLNRFNIKEIDITAYSSIEGNITSNMRLQKNRAESILKAISEYQLQEVKTKIESHENWDGFMQSIAGSPYESDFKGLSREEIRQKVNTADTLLGYNLEPYLESQRKADIRILVESIFVDSLIPEKLSEKFKRALEDKEYIRAKAVQTLMYRAVLDGSLDQQVLFEAEIPQFREHVPLLNNRLAFRLRFGQPKKTDSIINNLRMEVEALLGVDNANGHVNFNKQAIKLYYWANDLNFLVVDEENHLNQVKDFYKDIRRLYNTKIDNYKVNRLLLNYNIIAADYYYERKDFRNRVKALKQVMRYVVKAKLDRDQTFIMARYFIYQMQIGWAIEIMLPFIREGNYHEDFLLTFLSIAVYDKKQVPDEHLYKYMEVAADKFNTGFCKLFTAPVMSVEFLNDLRLKSIFCDHCQ